MNELAWIAEARKYIGLKEITGKNDHDLLDKGWLSFGQKWLFGQPWCGLFVAHCLRYANRYVVPLWFRARAWESDNMTKLKAPAYGCIVTFTRQGGGHVGFVVGKNAQGNIMVLGGNQSNMVNIAPFAQNRVTGYYWPAFNIEGRISKSTPAQERYNLPLLQSDGKLSTNEA
jgi:uncharacterized protein (TIGR02594 family)